MRDRREATADEARALANPLRLRILRLCLDASLTNKQLADRLGKDPATVLHHVRVLVETGFLSADAVRSGAKGALEKPYRATGKSWEINVGETSDEATWLAGIDALRAEVQEAGPPDPMVASFRLGIRLSPERLGELVERVGALGEEYAFNDDEDGEPLGFSVYLHRRKP
jgi:DNA-binding transcriptional ArsR family regulator